MSLKSTGNRKAWARIPAQSRASFFHRKISNSLNFLINFIFAQTYFLIASSQILKNDAIPFPIFESELIIIKYSNLFIKILFLKSVFLIISAIKEFIFKNWKQSSCRESFLLKKINCALLQLPKTLNYFFCKFQNFYVRVSEIFNTL